MSSFNDEQLIEYCEIHCETPRALFSGVHINRMIELAGKPKGYSYPIDPQRFISVHEEMKVLCQLAKDRLKKLREPLPNNVVDFIAYRVKHGRL